MKKPRVAGLFRRGARCITFVLRDEAVVCSCRHCVQQPAFRPSEDEGRRAAAGERFA
jgi:hypothetical protein